MYASVPGDRPRRPVPAFARRLGEAEVEQRRVAGRRHQDVRRLHVRVDHARRVEQRGECVGRLPRDPQRDRHIEPALFGENLREARAFELRHHDVKRRLLHARREHRQQVRVRHLAADPRLAALHLDRLRIAPPLLAQELDDVRRAWLAGASAGRER